MLEIKDSVAVITGGGSGIGLSLAEYWVKQGGKVVLGDIAEEPLKKAKEKIEGMGGVAEIVVCNVTNEDDCGRLADT
ncbi:MAG: SDR family NAD(P)-dependent oxidoreductase, partial [Deltaproteobacteria bacterium]|nr:SDR family NAD(P)-dependent oxidoreductase [Deltaproteobacteria bacterium]